jgi:hypothetical protein
MHRLQTPFSNSKESASSDSFQTFVRDEIKIGQLDCVENGG